MVNQKKRKENSFYLTFVHSLHIFEQRIQIKLVGQPVQWFHFDIEKISVRKSTNFRVAVLSTNKLKRQK